MRAARVPGKREARSVRTHEALRKAALDRFRQSGFDELGRGPRREWRVEGR